MKYIPRALRYLRPYWPLAVVSMVILVLDALVDLLQPWTMKIVVDHALGTEPLPEILAGPFGALAQDRVLLIAVAIGAGLLITIVNNGLTVLNTYIQSKIEQR